MSKMIPQNLNGILLLDKPLQMSSNGALQRVKRLFNAKKAGHTGSLDPLATGMLPICFGDATKFSQFLLESDKCYELAITLGVKTTTGDAEGAIVQTKSTSHVTQDALEKILPQFRGKILQVPPMFSALKYQGKPLYQFARQGIEIKREPRAVHIYDLQLKNFSEKLVYLSVHCSKGTYVRTLAEDIGDLLGCGAHVSALRRTWVKPYQNHRMLNFEDLEECNKSSGLSALHQFLLPIESSVSCLPHICLSTSAVFYIRMGQSVMTPNLQIEGGLVRIFSDKNQFLGVGEIKERRLMPRRLFQDRVKNKK